MHKALDGTRLFIGELSCHCDENHIQELFQSHNIRVFSVRLMRGKNSLTSLNYGFVQLGRKEDAVRAIAELDSLLFLGRRIRVRYATPSLGPNVPKSSKPTYQPSPNSIFVKFQALEVGIKVTEETLRNVFNMFGEINDVSIKASNLHGAPDEIDSGYGFVHFPDDERGISSSFRAIDTITVSPIIKGVEYTCEASQNLLRIIHEKKKQLQIQPSPTISNLSPRIIPHAHYDLRAPYSAPQLPQSLQHSRFHASNPPITNSLQSYYNDPILYQTLDQYESYDNTHLVSDQFSLTNEIDVQRDNANAPYSQEDGVGYTPSIAPSQAALQRPLQRYELSHENKVQYNEYESSCQKLEIEGRPGTGDYDYSVAGHLHVHGHNTNTPQRQQKQYVMQPNRPTDSASKAGIKPSNSYNSQSHRYRSTHLLAPVWPGRGINNSWSHDSNSSHILYNSSNRNTNDFVYKTNRHVCVNDVDHGKQGSIVSDSRYMSTSQQSGVSSSNHPRPSNFSDQDRSIYLFPQEVESLNPCGNHKDNYSSGSKVEHFPYSFATKQAVEDCVTAPQSDSTSYSTVSPYEESYNNTSKTNFKYCNNNSTSISSASDSQQLSRSKPSHLQSNKTSHGHSGLNALAAVFPPSQSASVVPPESYQGAEFDQN